MPRYCDSTEAAVLASLNGTAREIRWAHRLAVLLIVSVALVALLLIPTGAPEPGFSTCPSSSTSR
jgi:hypothetical protein